MTSPTRVSQWTPPSTAKRKIFRILFCLSLLGLLALPATPQTQGTRKKLEGTSAKSAPLLWEEPSDITSRDLFDGRGGKADAPASNTFVFEKEDLDGTTPKFVVKDASGVKWKIKLGVEAKPETAAARLVWGAGYFANKDYFLPVVKVTGIPGDLHRGKNLIGRDGTIRTVRLKREDEHKLSDWEWKHSPFQGTREWNGLRVLMAVLNNWDLKDVNNGVYAGTDGNGQPVRLYMVSDLGASFGKTSATKSGKGKLELYRKSRFIVKTSRDTVSFSSPGRMPVYEIFALPEYVRRMKIHWIANDVPRGDARWMGELLGHLSPSQIGDAFRAAGYSDEEVQGFVEVIERRIGQLREL
jgi:hypothetical protein